jgi:hypothetical protein
MEKTRQMKTFISIVLIILISFQSFGQLSQLDSLNGYKILKLGSPIGLYQGKVIAESMGVAGTYKVTDPEMLSIGDISLKKVVMQTVADTIRSITLTTDDVNGKNLYLAMYKKFGIPNGLADHINSSYIWKTNKLTLSIKKTGNDWNAIYSDVPFEKRLAKEKEKKKLSDF